MTEFWNQRYSENTHYYGLEPCSFFATLLEQMPPGNLLLPGEGEGRHGLYAAKRGWMVTAFDYSEIARKNALLLAKEACVEIDYYVSDLESFEPPSNRQFDLIALMYLHFDTEKLPLFFRRFHEWLVPGGKILIEGFSKDQLNYDSGGPSRADWLLDEPLLHRSCPPFAIRHLETTVEQLSHGQGHEGLGSVLRCVAVKE